MNGTDTLSIAVSVASLFVAFLAIYLSVKFYEMTSKISNETKDATREITASVEKLEKIFGLLYSDTFSMMKDAFQDFRKHSFLRPDLEAQLAERQAEADKQVNKMKGEILQQMNPKISEIVERKTEETDAKISEIQRAMGDLLDKAISESRNIEKSISLAKTIDKVLLTIYILEERWKRPILSKEIADYLLIQGESTARPNFLYILHRLISDKYLSKQTVKGNTSYTLTNKGRIRVEELLESRIGEDAPLYAKY